MTRLTAQFSVSQFDAFSASGSCGHAPSQDTLSQGRMMHVLRRVCIWWLSTTNSKAEGHSTLAEGYKFKIRWKGGYLGRNGSRTVPRF